MNERITSNREIELSSYTKEELFTMAQEAIMRVEEAMIRVQVGELEVANISQELRRRNHEVVMGEPALCN